MPPWMPSNDWCLSNWNVSATMNNYNYCHNSYCRYFDRRNMDANAWKVRAITAMTIPMSSIGITINLYG